jgi:hypothetical protein
LLTIESGTNAIAPKAKIPNTPDYSQSKLTPFLANTPSQPTAQEAAVKNKIPATPSLPHANTKSTAQKRNFNATVGTTSTAQGKRAVDNELDLWADFNTEVSTVKKSKWRSLHEAGETHAQNALAVLASPSKSMPISLSPTIDVPNRLPQPKSSHGATYGSSKRSFAVSLHLSSATPSKGTTHDGMNALDQLLRAGQVEMYKDASDDETQEDSESLKNLQALLAQGQSSKILGDLGYVVDGISAHRPTRIKRDNLLELLEEVSKQDVARTFVSSTLPSLVCRELHDEDDVYCRFLLACLVCVASEEGGSVVSFPTKDLVPHFLDMMTDNGNILTRNEANRRDKEFIRCLQNYLESFVNYLRGPDESLKLDFSCALVSLSALSFLRGLALPEMTANVAKFGEVLDMAMRGIAGGSDDSLTNSSVKIVGTALSILEDIVSETPAAASQLCRSLVGTTRTLLAMNHNSKPRCTLYR